MLVNKAGSFRFFELKVLFSKLCLLVAHTHLVCSRRDAAHIRRFRFSTRQKLREGGCFSKFTDIYRRIAARRQLILLIGHIRVDKTNHWRLVRDARWRFLRLAGATEVRPVVVGAGPLSLLAGSNLVDL